MEEIKKDGPVQSKTPLAASLLANDSAPKGAAPKAAAKPKASTAPKKGKHKHTHIEHHDNGTHTVRHTPAAGGPEVSYAANDMDGVHDGLEEHVGEPNGDEGQEQMAGGAAPQAEPAPAGAQPSMA